MVAVEAVQKYKPDQKDSICVLGSLAPGKRNEDKGHYRGGNP